MRTLFSIVFFLFTLFGTIKAKDITITEGWKICINLNADQAVEEAGKRSSKLP